MACSIVMPSFGMFTAEGSLLNWLRPAGAVVEAGEPLVEIETEKSVHVVEAPVAGILHPVAQVGSSLPVEALIAYILTPGEVPPLLPGEKQPAVSPAGEHHVLAATVTGPENSPGQRRSVVSAETGGELRASPIAKRLAAEYGIDLTQLKGTGPHGRIVESDVMKAAEQKQTIHASESVPSARQILRRLPLSGIRRTISDRLRQTLNTAASLTLTRQVPADSLVEARQILGERLGKTMSYDALFIKLLAVALRKNPEMNAIIENEEILLLDEIHIGFAVPVTGGLLVPVVRNADSEPLPRIDSAVRVLRERARSGQLSREEMAGGTATLTNLGAYGVDAFTPILNPPQSVILGIGRIAEQPVVRNGSLAVGHTCTLSLTFDHRVADGVPAAQLLEGIAQQMTDMKYMVSISVE